MAVLLARELSRRGHHVVVLCRPGSALEAGLHAAGLTHEPVLRGPDFPPPSVVRAMRALKRHRVDVLVSATSNDVRLGALAAWLSGVPVVVRGLGLHGLPGNRLDQLLWRRVTSSIVANSRATAEVLLEAHPWLTQAMVSVVPNGVDVERYAGARPVDASALGELAPGAAARPGPTIGYVGRLDPEKGPDLLIEAWALARQRLPDARLLIIGSGALEAKLRRATRDWPDVVWVGYRADTAPFVATMDLLVVPSRREAFGLAAAEAMAAGVPVIATRVGGLPEVVRDGVDGCLVPPLDSAALADAIVRLGSDARLRGEMGGAAGLRARAEWSPASAADGYLHVLRDVVARSDSSMR